MKHIIKTSIILAAVSALTVNVLAATPKEFYKPIKLPIYSITLPKMDFSAAVDAYLEEHPLDIG